MYVCVCVVCVMCTRAYMRESLAVCMYACDSVCDACVQPWHACARAACVSLCKLLACDQRVYVLVH